MTRRLGFLLFLASLVVLTGWLLGRPSPLQLKDLPEHEPDIGNGMLVFHAGGCAACHMSREGGEENPERLGGGLALDTAFGRFRVPNISPDPASGIGGWSALEFANAMLRGISPDGRHYYPAFPYTSYARMKWPDVIDLKAYLDSLPAVRKAVPDHELGFPWNLRRGIGLWKLRYLDNRPVIIFESPDPVVARGSYLVEGPGHCAECHTPRDRFGGLDRSRWLAGAASPDGEGRVPNITPHEDGLASWPQSDIVYYFESGFTPEFDTVGGAMVEVQENLARLPASDRRAIAAYLASIPGLPTTELDDSAE